MTDEQRIEVLHTMWAKVIEAAAEEDVEKTLAAIGDYLRAEKEHGVEDDKWKGITTDLLESAALHCDSAAFDYYASTK